MGKTTASKASTKPISLGAILLSGVLGLSFCWSAQHTLEGSGYLLLSLVTLAVFSAAICRSISMLLRSKTAYRAAVLLGWGLGAFCWLLQSISTGQMASPGWLGIWLAISLVGSMAASWIDLGLSDETFIPGPETTAEIQRLYRQATPKPPRVPTGKRIFDILLSLSGIILSAPLWLLLVGLIWVQDPGPIFFIKHSTGFRGKPFRLYKFRTMKTNAETKTGPVTSDKVDGRVLRGCIFLRQTALDELPQLANILAGEMSFVGPRPLRSVVEIENIQRIPGYLQRYDTLPGLAGLAQVCGSNQTPSRDKLRYEIVYAENASLLFDLKLIIIAVLIVFYLRWKKDWDGRIPRSWIRLGR
jgi:lipopolysaccharide/colanic/teichoic acid biosynthesis glycosyltransferase